MKLTDEQLEEVMNGGALGMSPTTIAKALRVRTNIFMRYWNQKESEIRKAYDAGKIQAEIDIGLGLKDSGAAGNVVAAQTHLKLMQQREIETLKRRIFMGDVGNYEEE